MRRAYAKEEQPPEGSEDEGANSRAGYSQKTLMGEARRMEIAVPRDRAGSIEPQLIRKGQAVVYPSPLVLRLMTGVAMDYEIAD